MFSVVVVVVEVAGFFCCFISVLFRKHFQLTIEGV